MKETYSYSVWRHLTGAPHYDLLIRRDGDAKHWIIPSGIPGGNKDKRLAVEEKFHDGLKDGAYGDSYGAGEGELWDEGVCRVELSRKIKLVLSLEGGRLSGRYLLIIPAWGRWTGKKLWVIEKIGHT